VEHAPSTIRANADRRYRTRLIPHLNVNRFPFSLPDFTRKTPCIQHIDKAECCF
jgi:hypothetical protein